MLFGFTRTAIGKSRLLFSSQFAFSRAFLRPFHVLQNFAVSKERIMASKLIRKVISTSNAPKAAGPYR